MRLTETKCRKAAQQTKIYRLSDGRGLYLVVPATGNKRWNFRYQFMESPKTVSFGRYPEVSLEKAREKREEARKLLAGGIDPSEQRKEEKLQKIESHRNTFEVVAEQWFNTRKAEWTEKYQKNISDTLRKYLYPYIGERPIRQITPNELLEALRKTESKGHHATVKKTLQFASRIFKFGIRMRLVEYDITPSLQEDLITLPAKHRPAIIKPDELGKLLLAIDTYKDRGELQVSHALCLLPFVFTRPKELVRGEWKEINWEKSRWDIPGEKMKKREDHVVPLSRQSLKILQDVHEHTGKYRYIFPSNKDPKRPMADGTISRPLVKLGYKGKHCPHGFRATARTLLDEEFGFSLDWIEQQLAHTVRDPLGRAYNRATHLENRREMMQKWADYLDGLKAKAEAAVSKG
ncbi:MAG: integrase arm-type DNA-binding domain-containing protein [Hyphomicrobiales bacterium]|nr:integrase arm-type DNA-binding domain-containing protein [Hyphomicrobiales bacterium]